MNASINQSVNKGDTVAYYNECGVRRVGIVKGWRDGKVIVEHKAGYTVLVVDIALYLIEEAGK